MKIFSLQLVFKIYCTIFFRQFVDLWTLELHSEMLSFVELLSFNQNSIKIACFKGSL